MYKNSAFALALWIIFSATSAFAQHCKNPGNIRYHPSNPQFYAPIKTRALGFLIEVDSNPRRPPDLKPECLPLGIRYNNPGALKTPNAGPWDRQIGKDTKGHAIFPRVEDGVVAWLTWVQRRAKSGVNTPSELMSMYAPPDDCVGSVAKLPNGRCPPGFSLNDTRRYAKRVAAALGVGPNDTLSLTGANCSGRRRLKAFFSEIMVLELGRAFCNKRCGIQGRLFNRAADKVFGSVPGCT